MNYQDVADEVLQTVLLHKNLFIDRETILKEIADKLEYMYNRGYDSGQASKDIVKPAVNIEKEMAAMAEDKNIQADCAAIAQETTEISRDAKLDAIVEEYRKTLARAQILAAQNIQKESEVKNDK